MAVNGTTTRQTNITSARSVTTADDCMAAWRLPGLLLASWPKGRAQDVSGYAPNAPITPKSGRIIQASRNEGQWQSGGLRDGPAHSHFTRATRAVAAPLRRPRSAIIKPCR
jgi:hypothetical protein